MNRRAALGLALGGLIAVGCGAEDVGPPPPTAPSASEQQATIDKIQNDPNMPQAAKDQAIAGYKAGMSRMGTGGPTPGTPAPAPKR